MFFSLRLRDFGKDRKADSKEEEDGNAKKWITLHGYSNSKMVFA
jgi:hypothetical protein